MKDLWVSSNKWRAKFSSSSSALYHCHISQWAKTLLAYVHGVEVEEVQWLEKGSAAPPRLAKTPIYGWPPVIYSGSDWLPSGGANMHSAFVSLIQNNPPPPPRTHARTCRPAPPRPQVSRQEKDQSESRALNPPPYALTNGPKPPRLSTHSLLMEVTGGGGTRANRKEANVALTQCWIYLCTAAGSVALSPPSPTDSWDPADPLPPWAQEKSRKDEWMNGCFPLLRAMRCM